MSVLHNNRRRGFSALARVLGFAAALVYPTFAAALSMVLPTAGALPVKRQALRGTPKKAVTGEEVLRRQLSQ